MMNEVMRRSERLYRLLLRLYPERFRRQFGEEMEFVFSASLQDACDRDGGRGIVVLLGWTLIDLFTSVFNEHMRDRREDQLIHQMSSLYAGSGIGLLRQPSARRKEYELRADNQLVGTLQWPKMFRALCVAETADGAWTFRQEGLINSRVIARATDSGQDVLVYRRKWTGMLGTMEHIDGREFGMKMPGWWGDRFALVKKPPQGEDVELLSVKINFTFLRGSADVATQPTLAQTEDAALLAMFSCYLVLMTYEELNGL